MFKLLDKKISAIFKVENVFLSRPMLFISKHFVDNVIHRGYLFFWGEYQIYAESGEKISIFHEWHLMG